MPQTTKQQGDSGAREVSAQNIIGGDDTDLASAMADADGASGDITFQKDDAAPEKKSPPKEAPQLTEEQEESGILQTMLELEGGGAAGEKEGEEQPKDLEIDGFEEVDTNMPSSPAIKNKFKRFKDNERAMKSKLSELASSNAKLAADHKAAQEALAEAQASAVPANIEESDPYLALKKERDELSEVVGRTRLEESPRFKKEFDEPRKGYYDDIMDYLAQIDDGDSKIEAVSLMDAAANVLPGKSNDPLFHKAMKAAMDHEGIPDYYKMPISQALMGWRKLGNKRFEAIEQWKDTTEKNGGLDLMGVREKTAEASTLFGKIRAKYEAENSDRLNIYRDPANSKSFGYDEFVKPGLQQAAEEIEKSVQVGAPTPNLLALVSQGAEFPFQMSMNAKLGKLLREQQATIKELEERVQKFQGGGTEGGSASTGSAPAKKSKSPDDYEGGSGILETMKELAESG